MDYHRKRRSRSERDKSRNADTSSKKPRSSSAAAAVSRPGNWRENPAVITRNRLTMRLGLFNQAKQSRTVSRDVDQSAASSATTTRAAGGATQRPSGSLVHTGAVVQPGYADPFDTPAAPLKQSTTKHCQPELTSAGGAGVDGSVAVKSDTAPAQTSTSTTAVNSAPDQLPPLNMAEAASYLISAVNLNSWFPHEQDRFDTIRKRLSAAFQKSCSVHPCLAESVSHGGLVKSETVTRQTSGSESRSGHQSVSDIIDKHQLRLQCQQQQPVSELLYQMAHCCGGSDLARPSYHAGSAARGVGLADENDQNYLNLASIQRAADVCWQAEDHRAECCSPVLDGWQRPGVPGCHGNAAAGVTVVDYEHGARGLIDTGSGRGSQSACYGRSSEVETGSGHSSQAGQYGRSHLVDSGTGQRSQTLGYERSELADTGSGQRWRYGRSQVVDSRSGQRSDTGSRYKRSEPVDTGSGQRSYREPYGRSDAGETGSGLLSSAAGYGGSEMVDTGSGQRSAETMHWYMDTGCATMPAADRCSPSLTSTHLFPAAVITQAVEFERDALATSWFTEVGYVSDKPGMDIQQSSQGTYRTSDGPYYDIRLSDGPRYDIRPTTRYSDDVSAGDRPRRGDVERVDGRGLPTNADYETARVPRESRGANYVGGLFDPGPGRRRRDSRAHVPAAGLSHGLAPGSYQHLAPPFCHHVSPTQRYHTHTQQVGIRDLDFLDSIDAERSEDLAGRRVSRGVLELSQPVCGAILRRGTEGATPPGHTSSPVWHFTFSSSPPEFVMKTVDIGSCSPSPQQLTWLF